MVCVQKEKVGKGGKKVEGFGVCGRRSRGMVRKTELPLVESVVEAVVEDG